MTKTLTSIEDELYDIERLRLALEALVSQIELESSDAQAFEAHVTGARAELRAALQTLVSPRRAPLRRAS
jgi:hypothetical protein